MIPRVIHIVWIGPKPAPERCIQSWRDMNPDWQVRVWGNKDMMGQLIPWRLQPAINVLMEHEINGAADCLRWEILYRHGGFATDADAECIRRLPAELFVGPFAAYENEMAAPGLVATGAMAFGPQDPLVGAICERIARRRPEFHLQRQAWQSVGPQLLTEEIAASGSKLRILPSHYFYPRHYTGVEYKGDGPVYARQFWGSTDVPAHLQRVRDA